ncbi:MAG: 50S ribosomal protein L29 [bacterium]
MAAGEYRDLTPEELHKRLEDAQQELFTLRLRVGPQRNGGRIRLLRQQVARMKTVLAEKGTRA